MPKLSQILVRLSLCYLIAGASIGLLLHVSRATGMFDMIWVLRPVHIEFLLYGWLIQFAFGVASWILPRKGAIPSAGRLALGAVTYNAGILFAAAGGVLGLTHLPVVGRLAELAGIALVVSTLLPRIRGLGKQAV